jgi:signal transduction histidine kinase
MNDVAQSRPKLRRRILIDFLLLASFCCGLFALFNVVFMYVTEDSIFERQLSNEINRQLQMPTPGAPPYSYLQLYYQPAEFPADLASAYQHHVAPNGEYAGTEGRHYHLQQFMHPSSHQPLYLVAEVSQQLVVRPGLAEILVFNAVMSGIILIVALLFGWYLARRASKPLTELALLLNQQPLPDDFAHRFIDEEIHVLAEKLQQSMRDLLQSSERERQFSRMASHELRTPLAVIQTSCELLLLQQHDPVAQRRIKQIQHASLKMQHMTSTLLWLARQEQIVATHVHWHTELEAIWQQQQQWQRRPDLQLQIELGSDSVWVLPVEPLKLLIANLLQNMLRHSDSGICQVEVLSQSVLLTNPRQRSAPDVNAMRSRDFAVSTAPADEWLHGFGCDIASRLALQCGLNIRHQPGDGYWQTNLTKA